MLKSLTIFIQILIFLFNFNIVGLAQIRPEQPMAQNNSQRLNESAISKNQQNNPIHNTKKPITKSRQEKSIHNTKKPTTKTHKKITKFTTKASWYGPHFNGKKTASGQIFNQNQLTAASKILPFGTKVLVKNPRNGKTCVVTINDRGPYVKGRGIDLSKASAQKLGITGVSPVICYANASSPTKFTSVKAYRTKSGGYHFTIFMKIKRAFHKASRKVKHYYRHFKYKVKKSLKEF